MDRELVLRAKAGDHAAFTAIAAASISRLHRVARLILRDDDLANDAVQEALVAAWRDLRAVRDPDRFDAWLHRLLVRACYREAGRRRRQVIEIDVAPLDVPSTADAARDLAIRDQLERGSATSRPSTGRPSRSTTTSASRTRRRPRCSGSPRAPTSRA